MDKLAASNPFFLPSQGVPMRVARKVSAAAPAEGKWEARYSHPVPHTNEYYMKCMVGGVLSCGLTHTFVVPLDVVKCNMQTNPKVYSSLVGGFKTLVATEGSAGLVKGWFPTLIGYSAQGFCKFGFYEIFKDVYATLAGKENYYNYRGLIWLSASASAEFFADIALCPMEMVKVKVQTSPTGTWPTSFLPALAKMQQNKADTRFPFGSLVPLWSRQIPYTMAKFFFFEKVVELFYSAVFTRPRTEYSKGTQLGITFASGYIAGVVCAIVSHPADTLVSQMGKETNKGKSMGAIASEFGYGNLLTRGLGTRIIMIGTLTGLQWWIYDAFKTYFGLGTSGGVAAKK
jgi:solute carrier family 25 phosphate transporter 3